VLGNLFGRQRSVPFLLGKGFRARAPRCTLCGREMGSPRRQGEKFKLGGPVAGPKIGVRHAATRLFLGTSVLVTRVNPHLVARLADATSFLGDKVLVATPPRWGQRKDRPYLFCVRCGWIVLARVSGETRRCYSWDWLAETGRRGLVNRARTTLRGLKPLLQRRAWLIFAPRFAWRPAAPADRSPFVRMLQLSHLPAARTRDRSS